MLLPSAHLISLMTSPEIDTVKNPLQNSFPQISLAILSQLFIHNWGGGEGAIITRIILYLNY